MQGVQNTSHSNRVAHPPSVRVTSEDLSGHLASSQIGQHSFSVVDVVTFRDIHQGLLWHLVGKLNTSAVVNKFNNKLASKIQMR